MSAAWRHYTRCMKPLYPLYGADITAVWNSVSLDGDHITAVAL